MKRKTLHVIGAIAALGLADPVAAQQSMMDQPTAMVGSGMMGAGMMTGGMMSGGMMSGGMMGGGMMGGQNSYAMRMFDSNMDGTLSPEELTAGIQGEVETYDTDKNGTLSLEEFAVMYAAHTRIMMVRTFQMHDEDGDGQVTKAEMATMGAMMQQMMTSSAPNDSQKADTTDHAAHDK